MSSRLGKTGVLVVIAAALVASACDSSSNATYPEDDRSALPGADTRYVEQPDAILQHVLVAPWIRRIPVGGGRSTFGRELPRLVRIDIDGTGPLTRRDITLETKPAVELFSGPGEQRMRHAIHGMLTVLDERGGYIRGISITTSRASFEAASIAPIIESNVLEGDISAADQRSITKQLADIADESGGHALAWYYPATTWITVGPQIGSVLRRHATRPGKVTPAKAMFVAYVLRHEFEHSVTPASDEAYERLQWLEEGSADALAAWPGASARTARLMGLPYPKRYEHVLYRTSDGGYPEWANVVRLLLRAAGVETGTPHELDAATILLQDPKLQDVPGALARAIADEQGLPRARMVTLRRDIARLDGDERRARQLVGAWLER